MIVTKMKIYTDVNGVSFCNPSFSVFLLWQSKTRAQCLFVFCFQFVLSGLVRIYSYLKLI